jgi:hypothetical protein
MHECLLQDFSEVLRCFFGPGNDGDPLPRRHAHSVQKRQKGKRQTGWGIRKKWGFHKPARKWLRVVANTVRRANPHDEETETSAVDAMEEKEHKAGC